MESNVKQMCDFFETESKKGDQKCKLWFFACNAQRGFLVPIETDN